MHSRGKCGRVGALFATMLVALLVAGCGGARRPLAEASYRYSSNGLIPVSPVGGGVGASAGGGGASAGGAGVGAAGAIASLASRAVAMDLSHLPPGTSAVAWAAMRPVAVYAAPGDRHPQRTFPTRDQFGITQVFLVKRAIPGWLEVYLPVRPNDSTAWVRSTTVAMSLDPYSVVVDTTRHELTVQRAGQAVMHAPVGIGKAATPTPHGLFYVIEELRMVPSTGPYGTYAFGLSAYSNVLTTFGTGDAQVALHGTNEPWSIGQDTSNGCVHMSDSVANWLARTVPLGTPVQIV